MLDLVLRRNSSDASKSCHVEVRVFRVAFICIIVEAIFGMHCPVFATAAVRQSNGGGDRVDTVLRDCAPDLGCLSFLSSRFELLDASNMKLFNWKFVNSYMR
jgi:hypothetical protein